jgi:hypothetical protein
MQHEMNSVGPVSSLPGERCHNLEASSVILEKSAHYDICHAAIRSLVAKNSSTLPGTTKSGCWASKFHVNLLNGQPNIH